VGFLPSFVSVSAFPHDISTTDAAKITKLNIEMFHDKSWKPIYSEVKSSKVKVTSHQRIDGSLHSCECWLLLVSTTHIGFLQKAESFISRVDEPRQQLLFLTFPLGLHVVPLPLRRLTECLRISYTNCKSSPRLWKMATCNFSKWPHPNWQPEMSMQNHAKGVLS